ncbi:MAG TPA: NAD(P)-dependent oxidoreductase [Pseudolabrys sp.]|nr:NAD(P)-dependent oxidoreductase [Pseudolabrys sp.]
MANVLVTGASGFLGAAVVGRLSIQGHRTVGLDPAPTSAAHRHVKDDLSDRKRLEMLLRDEKISHVLHCGGISGPMVMSDDPARVMDINVTGSLNLLQAALASGVKTFVYCSSVSALGNFYEEKPVTDDYPLRPTSAYGSSKAAMDMVLRGLWRRVPLDLCSLRFTSIYGPGRQTRFVVDDIVVAAISGEPASVEPTSDWPYIYIDDAADAAVAACFSSTRRQLYYFVAYPEQVTLEQFAQAAREGSGRPVSLNIDGNAARAMRGPLDIAPARQDFGFAPKVDHREGIRRMVEARRAMQT